MRVLGFALLLVGLAAPHALAAPPGSGRCPTIQDRAGDASSHGQHDQALDITAVEVDITPRQVTATLRLAGKPDPASVGSGRKLEVYFTVPEQGTFVLRATVGNGQERYELIDNTTYASSPDNGGAPHGSAQSWTYVRDLSGRLGPNSVTIVAQQPRDLPLNGGATVFGRTWVTVADTQPVEAAGVRAWGNGGVAAGVDNSAQVELRFSPRQGCRRAK